MSEHKRRVHVWVPTVILGVVALLFSVYAIQSQTEAQDAQEKIEQLEQQLVQCQKVAEEQARNAQMQMVQAAGEAAMARKLLEECQKTTKRK